MPDKEAFLILPIPDHAWNLPDEYMLVLVQHQELATQQFRLPWPVEMIPDEGEEVGFAGIGYPCEFVAGKTEYAYSNKSGYTSYTFLQLTGKDSWEDGCLTLTDLRYYAHEGFILDSGVSVKDAFQCAKLELPDE